MEENSAETSHVWGGGEGGTGGGGTGGLGDWGWVKYLHPPTLLPYHPTTLLPYHHPLKLQHLRYSLNILIPASRAIDDNFGTTIELGTESFQISDRVGSFQSGYNALQLGQ